MKPAAIYARVSSDRQKKEQTIKSQTAALIERTRREGYTIPQEWIFEDEGYSGAVLVRPGLEHLRDLAAEGQIQAVWVYSPDRLSRKYAYQVLLMEEFARHGVEVLFIRSPKAHTPEEQLLLQFQGMIAEYERAQIAERTRREAIVISMIDRAIGAYEAAEYDAAMDFADQALRRLENALDHSDHGL